MPCRLPFPIGDDGFDKGVLICTAMVARLSGLALSDCAYIPDTAFFTASRRRLQAVDQGVSGSIQPEFRFTVPKGSSALALSNAIYANISSIPEAFQVRRCMHADIKATPLPGCLCVSRFRVEGVASTQCTSLSALCAVMSMHEGASRRSTCRACGLDPTRRPQCGRGGIGVHDALQMCFKMQACR